MSLNQICQSTNARTQLPIKTRVDSIDFISSQSQQSNVLQRDASYTGGTGGPGQFVNNCLKVITTANAQTGQNEWNLTATTNNLSNDPNVENNGAYFQINKMGDSKSWGATIEANEDSATYTTSLVGCELDLFGNGGNKSISQKVGLDIVIGKKNPALPAIQPYAGIAIRNNGNNAVVGQSAILIEPNGVGQSGNTWDEALKLYDGARIAFSTGNYLTFSSGKFRFFVGGLEVQTIP